MKTFNYSIQDILLLKWKFLLLVSSITICSIIFILVSQIEAKANREVSVARSELQSALQSIDEIEEEEATIIEYIDRYNELASRGVVSPEDRLQFKERVAEIRAGNNLFPISLKIDKQSRKLLQYPIDEPEPGKPITLQSSLVELTLPLLHEDDMSRLLEQLINSPGMYQIKECSLQRNNQNYDNYLYLGQHFSSACEIMWYTFNLNDNSTTPINPP